MPEFISIGECMVELFSDQPLEEAETFTRSLAGDSLNILVAASRLGTSTGYITRLGSDPFTDYLLKTWENEGIDTSHVRKIDGFNAVHFVAQLPRGDREFVYYRKGSAPSTMSPHDIDVNYISSAKIVHISGITQAISQNARETVYRAASLAKDNNVKVSYDPNYRHQLWSPIEARKAMQEIMPYVNYFLPSCPADTKILFDTGDPREAAQKALAYGPELAAVTCGENGTFIMTRSASFDIPAYTYGSVIDTAGSGDTFKGTFLHGILEGMSVHQAGHLASVAAGLNLRGRGALTAMPTKSEIHGEFNNLGIEPKD